MLEEDKKLFPFSKVKVILALILFLMVMDMVRGSSKFESILGIPYCSVEYWVAYSLALAGCYFFYRLNKVTM